MFRLSMHNQSTKRLQVQSPKILVLFLLMSCAVPTRVDSASCTIQIRSIPDGANIFVNDLLQGVTPYEMVLPDQNTKYQLRLTLRGFQEHMSKISCSTPPSQAIQLVSDPRINVRIAFPRDPKYDGCGARVALNWRSGRFSLGRMELFPGDEKSYSGYKVNYMTLIHSGYFFCPTDAKTHCVSKSRETEVIFDQNKSYEIAFSGQGAECKTVLVER